MLSAHGPPRKAKSYFCTIFTYKGVSKRMRTRNVKPGALVMNRFNVIEGSPLILLLSLLLLGTSSATHAQVLGFSKLFAPGSNAVGVTSTLDLDHRKPLHQRRCWQPDLYQQPAGRSGPHDFSCNTLLFVANRSHIGRIINRTDRDVIYVF